MLEEDLEEPLPVEDIMRNLPQKEAEEPEEMEAIAIVMAEMPLRTPEAAEAARQAKDPLVHLEE